MKILAQNTLDAFSDPKTAKALLGLLADVRPDVAIFPEAYREDSITHLPTVLKQLGQLGYDTFHGLYNDTDGRKDRHGTMLVVQKGLSTTKKPRLLDLADRTAAECWLTFPGTNHIVHFVGVHLNDRTESKRQTELNSLLAHVDVSNGPTIVAGDLNSLHKSDAKGKQIRKARLYKLLVALKLVKVHDPTGQPMPNNLGRKASIYTRLYEMSSGKTVQRLEGAGFTDADSKHQPTFRADDPSVQIDHIMLSLHFTVKKFAVLPAGFSDHRGIVAEVGLKAK